MLLGGCAYDGICVLGFLPATSLDPGPEPAVSPSPESWWKYRSCSPGTCSIETSTLQGTLRVSLRSGSQALFSLDWRYPGLDN